MRIRVPLFLQQKNHRLVCFRLNLHPLVFMCSQSPAPYRAYITGAEARARTLAGASQSPHDRFPAPCHFHRRTSFLYASWARLVSDFHIVYSLNVNKLERNCTSSRMLLCRARFVTVCVISVLFIRSWVINKIESASHPVRILILFIRIIRNKVNAWMRFYSSSNRCLLLWPR